MKPDSQSIVNDLAALPPVARKKVLDYISLLQSQYTVGASKITRSAGELSGESFVGMWQDRSDLDDSVSWVREARRQQWRCNQ